MKLNPYEKFAVAGMVAAGVFIIACVGAAVAVVSDSGWLLFLSGGTLFLSLTVIVVGLIAALVGKKWLMAIGVAGGLAISLMAGFLTLIMIGAGQHHAPQPQAEYVEEEPYGINENNE